jgi:hypothetical protein
MMLTAAVDAQKPVGSTPTVPSLQGALEHATTWATAHPTHRVAVVYATDGEPEGCDSMNTVANAATIAGAAFAATPIIPTYVLGVGPPMTDCAHGQGWQYSPDMMQINLCGAQCAAVKADQGGKLKVQFGCATIVAPPR